MKPFAVLSGASQTPVWADELAAHGIMCLGTCSLAVPETFIKDHRPYIYSVGPTPEQAGRLTGKLVTNLLAGKKAAYAGNALKDKERVFGVVHYDTVDGQQKSAFAALKQTLDDGRVKLAADLPFLLDLARAQENARTMIAKLKSEGVTSVIFTGDPLTPASLTNEATAQNYFPEWVIGSNVLVDIALFGRTYDQEQWQHAFGLALTPSRVNLDADESYALYRWAYDKAPPNNTHAVILADLESLFTGIHLAGPTLTPESLEAGLFRFPVTGGTSLLPTVSRAPRDLARAGPRRLGRHRPHLVGPEGSRPGRDRRRRRRPLPVHEGGEAVHARRDAAEGPGAVRPGHVDHDLRDGPARLGTTGLPAAC